MASAQQYSENAIIASAAEPRLLVHRLRLSVRIGSDATTDGYRAREGCRLSSSLGADANVGEMLWRAANRMSDAPTVIERRGTSSSGTLRGRQTLPHVDCGKYDPAALSAAPASSP